MLLDQPLTNIHNMDIVKHEGDNLSPFVRSKEMATKKTGIEDLEALTVKKLRALAREKKVATGTWIAGADKEHLIRELLMSEGDKESSELALLVDKLAEHIAKMVLRRVRKDLNNGSLID